MEKLKKELSQKKYEWAFFDYFDTIVHRRVSINDIRKQWSKNICKKFNLNITASKMYEIRLASELFVEKASKFDGEYTYKDVCKEIYKRLYLTKNIILDIKLEEFYIASLTEEVNLESENQFVNDKIFNIIQEIKLRGVKLALISDFYMPKEVFNKWLQHHGILNCFDSIFISCECKCNKRKGKIYRYVLDELKIVNPTNAVMMGDNKHSDYIKAKENGINARWIKNKYIEESFDTKEQIEEKLKLIFKQNKKKRDFEYANYAFVLYKFIYELKKSLLKDGFDNVYFLAREGEFLKQLFDLYNKLTKTGKVKSNYLYSSRVASYVPTLKYLQEESFDLLFEQYPDINLRSFLKSVGFNEQQTDLVKKEINFSEVEFDLPINWGGGAF